MGVGVLLGGGLVDGAGVLCTGAGGGGATVGVTGALQPQPPLQPNTCV